MIQGKLGNLLAEQVGTVDMSLWDSLYFGNSAGTRMQGFVHS